MKTIALTGSIGMGKSTVAAMFADLGAPVWDADAAVHRLYAPGGAGVAPVLARFPEAAAADAPPSVDREKLSACVLNDPAALKDLEVIVHPLVALDRATVSDAAEQDGAPACVFDIPLLFEGGLETFFDVVVVVSAPADVQRARVLARPGMTAEKFEAIKARQTPDADKRARADHVVDTGAPLDETRRQVAEIWAAVTR
ncbi:MAG: dephospho-CoA kinase [Pseudomonadota bacterium]